MLAETHRSVVPLAGNLSIKDLSIKDNLHQLLWEVGRGNEKKHCQRHNGPEG